MLLEFTVPSKCLGSHEAHAQPGKATTAPAPRYGSATTTGESLCGYFDRAETGVMKELRPSPGVDFSLRLAYVAELETWIDLGPWA